MRYAKATLVEAGIGYEVRVEFYDRDGHRVRSIQEPMDALRAVAWYLDSGWY
jgi:hypothetical protein